MVNKRRSIAELLLPLFLSAKLQYQTFCRVVETGREMDGEQLTAEKVNKVSLASPVLNPCSW
jgi:hypothetical protein